MAVERERFGDVPAVTTLEHVRRLGRAVAAGGAVGRQAASAALGFAFPFALGAGSGGYWPPAWGWAALTLFWICALVLLTDSQVILGGRQALLPGALLALAAWDLVSVLWSSSLTQPVLEAQLALVYAGAALAAVLVVRSATHRALLAGALAAVVLICAYGLTTRLFPERLGSIDDLTGYRLAQPLGYFNALGIFSVLGILLALGFAARARVDGVRALAGASVVVLLPTLYFTFSRGSWIALAVGLAVALAADSRRLQCIASALVLAPWAVLAVWLAERQGALTHRGTQLAAASHAGHRYALELTALIVAAAASTWALALLGRRIRLRPVFVVAFRWALTLAVAALLAAGLARFGSPATIARHAYDSFLVRDESIPRGDLNQRLFTLANTRRLVYWRAAWREYRLHPLLGSGSGSYERYWNQLRPFEYKVRDAHNLYLETLAETGPVGLAFLLAALLTPIVAFIRTRRETLGAFACAGYVAFLVHAGLDWDWEMPAVTVTALFCAVVLLVGGRSTRERSTIGKPLRVGLIAASVVLAVLAFVGLQGNRAVTASKDAAAKADWAKAAGDARRATRWAPWSARGWQLLGEAQFQEGRRAAARTSFVKALSKDEEDWTIWLDLAIVSRGAQQRRAFAEAATLNPLGSEVAAYAAEFKRGKKGEVP